jgi:transcriptional regulator with XRE-family HTH domain
MIQRIASCMAYDADPPIGPALRRLREKRELTIEQAAARAKVTPNYLGEVERSKRNPTLKVVARILAGLPITWAEFGALVDDMSGSRSSRRPLESADLAE